MNDEDERSAKFNEGIQILFRIGKLKEQVHNARLFGDERLWFAALQGIRSEINNRLNKDKKKAENQSERDYADNYERAIWLYLNNKRDVVINLDGKKGKVGELDIYAMLYTYELWLGDMKEKYKFGMPDEDNEEGL